MSEFRRYAQICIENAEKAPSEGDRRALLNLARNWLQLASGAEGRQQLVTSDTLASVHPSSPLNIPEQTPRSSHSPMGDEDRNDTDTLSGA